MEKQKRGISGSTLKLIALFAMLIDHIAACDIDTWLRTSSSVVMDSQTYEAWYAKAITIYRVDMVMRGIGRLGFPLFVFLLVEGFQHTRSLTKYARNLFLFALISEIPFDLAFEGVAFSFEGQNVFFTLFIGLLVLAALRGMKAKSAQIPAGLLLNGLFCICGAAAGALTVWMLTDSFLAIWVDFESLWILWGAAAGFVLAILLCFCLRDSAKRQFSVEFLPLAAGILIAQLLHTDYGGWGILTIAAVWMLRKDRVLGCGIGCAVLSVSTYYELPAFLILLPVSRYNGERGLKLKFLFYAFYPAHLLLLYVLTLLLGFQSFQLI